ncbi:hypothetical protein ACFLRA_02525 [Bdellovibrionota bacterium]
MNAGDENLAHDKNALEIIFHKHFYANTGLEPVEIAKLVATEYLEYLQLKCGAYVPERYRNTVILDLMEEIKEMVHKKISGFPNIPAYLEENHVEVTENRDNFEKKYFDLF